MLWCTRHAYSIHCKANRIPHLYHEELPTMCQAGGDDAPSLMPQTSKMRTDTIQYDASI